jgi:hypothetical protein
MASDHRVRPPDYPIFRPQREITAVAIYLLPVVAFATWGLDLRSRAFAFGVSFHSVLGVCQPNLDTFLWVTSRATNLGGTVHPDETPKPRGGGACEDGDRRVSRPWT